MRAGAVTGVTGHGWGLPPTMAFVPGNSATSDKLTSRKCGINELAWRSELQGVCAENLRAAALVAMVPAPTSCRRSRGAANFR